jgi:benzoyl-CoA reductase/2-hydroxyglutaryl-CoA dehydratase subunit BcrC/BadD/HgdB
VIGITATVPVEVIYAAGRTPRDLNNLFITGPDPGDMVSLAEDAGFPPGVCCWIKGIYAVCRERGIRDVIAVTGGDCSNTIALGEVLAGEGVNVIPFEYPLHRDREFLKCQMERLARTLSADWGAVRETKAELDRIRGKLKQLDRLTYRENKVTGSENHLFLVASSDFDGDPVRFERRLDRFLADAGARTSLADGIRLGYLGVPPILSDFYEFIETLGGRVVYNEVQRQFSMPYGHEDILDQYLAYTYPYDVQGRLNDIAQAVEERRLDGLVHYAQTFCYRQIYDILLRKAVKVPLLTLEGDRPGPMDGRTALRLETFVHMLKENSALTPSR